MPSLRKQSFMKFLVFKSCFQWILVIFSTIFVGLRLLFPLPGAICYGLVRKFGDGACHAGVGFILFLFQIETIFLLYGLLGKYNVTHRMKKFHSHSLKDILVMGMQFFSSLICYGIWLGMNITREEGYSNYISKNMPITEKYFNTTQVVVFYGGTKSFYFGVYSFLYTIFIGFTTFYYIYIIIQSYKTLEHLRQTNEHFHFQHDYSGIRKLFVALLVIRLIFMFFPCLYVILGTLIITLTKNFQGVSTITFLTSSLLIPFIEIMIISKEVFIIYYFWRYTSYFKFSRRGI
uniref:G_PROTEIN_RECEP_F1_2 domain-containing protein n=1 Tax=Strongyloides venezuelensis TaxID=75913 RepID=A0A0K0FY63_STRVS